MKKPAKTSRKKPVHVEKYRDLAIPIYAKPVGEYQSFLVSYYSGGRRIQERAKTLEAAKAKAKAAIKQITEGSGRLVALTAVEVADYVAAVRTLRPLGNVSLSDIAAEYIAAAELMPKGAKLRDAASDYAKAHKRKSDLAAVSVAELKDKFLAAKEAEELSDRYIEDATSRLTKFAGAFRCNIASVTAAQITTWLDGIKARGRTRNNYRNAIIALFRYARSQNYLPRNEVTEAELVPAVKAKPSAIGIYAPDELATMLPIISKDLLPSVAIAALAGVRSQEILRLNWEDIRYKQGDIVVAADKAKTASRRLVPLLPALRAWLEACDKDKKKSGPIVTGFAQPQSWNRAVSRDIARYNAKAKAAGRPEIPRIHNGLRHSFASYRLAIQKDAAAVALEMGNSPRKLFENYRELVTPAEAKKWFAVAPAKGGKVIDFEAAAAA
jgi:integrase